MDITSIEHNDVFDLAHRFVTETNENIFLTGKAGTGKTTFLKYIKENCSKNIVVAAPTGVASINAGGVTLHSLFQLPFNPFLPTKAHKEELLSRIRYNKQRQQLLRKMELLVIDEISMVRCDTLDAVDTILRSVRHKYHLPFGGVQVLFIGDLYQLSPVAQRNEWDILREYYPSTFFFDSNVIKEQMPLLIELNTVYRQKEDSFVTLLNKVRNNKMTHEDFDHLHRRYDPGFRPSLEENYITLTSHNNQADLINHRELQKLPAPSLTYQAIIEGDFPENNYPAEDTLVLKEGAQVMFLKNDVTQKRYFNGKIGVIRSLDHDEIVVDCNGVKISVLPETWENTRYVLNRADGKLEQESLGTFKQFPLRLAWAITIHKSQGLTFEKVMIDAGAAFSSGQVYVALSRCTSLDGIVLLSKIPKEAIYSNDNVIKGHDVLTHKGSLPDRFAVARQTFTQQLLKEIFSFDQVNSAVELLYSQVKGNQNKLNAEALQWTEKLKNSFAEDKAIGSRFIKKIEELMKQERVVESNEVLQKRINDAATHFHPKFTAYQQDVHQHPVVTEHREVATIIDETLSQLILSLHLANDLLAYCKQPFSITAFLQHKLKYSQPRFSITTYASGKNQSFGDIPHPSLYDQLRHWRNTILEETGMPIYMVANQVTLKEVATYLPRTKKDLLLLSGFGKTKVDKYGDDIIAFVESYCSANNLESNIDAKAANPKRERKEKSGEAKVSTKSVSLKLFKEGRSVAGIAKERNLAASTIENHLSSYVASGEIDIDDLVAPEKQFLVKEAGKVHGFSSHKTLKENLPEHISYGEIRLVVASLKEFPENNLNTSE